MRNHLTLRPIASIGWLPSIKSYDDNSGGEIKAGVNGVEDYDSVQSIEMLLCEGLNTVCILIGWSIPRG